MKKTLFIIAVMIFGIVYFDKYRFLLKKYETDIIDVE
ncbi:hypothetical protein EII36_10250 [Staphylococcus epidermidis]|uniref:Uncharacterized protein n=1 Tax=Staphylococcus epidermidis TaxID=1282 RepID=A0AAE5V7Q0_STAEP|nr:hypothetical protein [Staphylococcus epidermidis]CVX89652.1 Uncharacterised protein [Streptococcus pneumoniae]MBM0829343.1 hypothetical protein [Staphylococcus epidermidis]MBM0870726.1 hypothetical protein [Staphylococcus epidermidis]NAM14777.1 hypothetical protein [Staphylococcus epidermidis]